MAAGPDIRPTGRMDGLHVTDVTPTVLALLGLAVPADLDGRVLTDALTEDFLARHPIETGKAETEDLPTADEAYSAEDRANAGSRL